MGRDIKAALIVIIRRRATRYTRLITAVIGNMQDGRAREFVADSLMNHLKKNRF
jgi:hypothetical protein